MTIEMSPTIGQLAAALAAAQGEIIGAVADSVNPYYRSRYADLASVWEAIRGPLSRNGLAVIQLPSTTEGRVSVTSVLAHKSGEWIATTASATPPPKSDKKKEDGKDEAKVDTRGDAQAVGSCISYLRRYLLSAQVGVAQVDDDGNAATGVQVTEDQRPTRQARQRSAARRADTEAEVISIEQAPEQTTAHAPEQTTAQAPAPSAKVTVASLWARAQRAGKNEDWWRQALATYGITKDRATHTSEKLALLSDAIDQVEGVNKDVP